MSSANIVIPVKKNTHGYNKYCEFIKPYLDVFGMPYDEVEMQDVPERLSRGAALIFLAQGGLILSDAAAGAIAGALEDGCGLVCTDGATLHNSVFSELCTFFDMPSLQNGDYIEVCKAHYATRYHSVGEKMSFYAPCTFYTNTTLKNGEVILNIGNTPLLELAQHKSARIALWQNVSWISPDVFGPLHGMDDIFRDCIVWAAKKPFAMKGMPPFVGMRVDDVWGAWRDKTPENPLLWMDMAAEHGFKPWLGLFQDNIDDKSIEIVRNYINSGRATAFPHAFAGCEYVLSDIPEHWAYFDHRRFRPWSDEVMAENAKRIKEWYDEKGIKISKLALPHYYETGENALQYFIDWGCEFIGIHMPPDASYFSRSRLAGAPYRNAVQYPCNAKLPIYYADYLPFPHNPKIDKKLFNCVTEIRDVRGYELAPTNDVADTIESGVTQLRRAITSSVPAVLFTHESCWIQRIDVENWKAEVEGFANGISDLNPIYDTMDNICKYVRASHDIVIKNAEVDELGKIKLTISGKNDMDTKCLIFTESNGSISESWHTIPRAI